MGDYGKNWLLTNDAGSGPYVIQEIKLEEYLLGKKYASTGTDGKRTRRSSLRFSPPTTR